MSEEREPTRLRDDAATDEALRAMLDAVRGEVADAAMLDRVLGKIVAGGGGGGSSGGASATKIASAIGAAVGVVGVVALVLSTRTAAPPVTRVVVPIDAQPMIDASISVDAAEPPIDAGTDAHVVAARDHRPLPTTEIATDQAMMLRATREHDPARQLAIALEHRAHYAASPLAEDREALIVVDLASLGRASDARAAAEAFRARWPRSPHQPHIDAALARMGAP